VEGSESWSVILILEKGNTLTYEFILMKICVNGEYFALK
jgi:hypothetical protein